MEQENLTNAIKRYRINIMGVVSELQQHRMTKGAENTGRGYSQ